LSPPESAGAARLGAALQGNDQSHLKPASEPELKVEPEVELELEPEPDEPELELEPEPEPDEPEPAPKPTDAVVATTALETRWFFNEHVWLSAARAPWSVMSTAPDVQLSIKRTVELRDSGDGNHAVLWPVLRAYVEEFVADTRGCVQRSALLPRQREGIAYELLGLDVVVSADLSQCTALEVNARPRQQHTEGAMQLVCPHSGPHSQL
jgi:hypothetical protein